MRSVLTSATVALGLLLGSGFPGLAAPLEDEDLIGTWSLAGRQKLRVKREMNTASDVTAFLTIGSGARNCALLVVGDREYDCTWSIASDRRAVVQFDQGELAEAFLERIADELDLAENEVETSVDGFDVTLRRSRSGALKLRGKGGGAARLPWATRPMRAKLKLKGLRPGG